MLKPSYKQTLNQLETIIHSLFSDENTGHDFAHIKRVVNLTARFVDIGINEFVALSIAYLHDVFDDKINKVDNINEALRNFFKVHNLNFEGFEDEIILGVSQIGYKGGLGVKNKTREASIVSDADYLDAIGAIGIARTLYYANRKNTPLVDSLIHFDEKLFKLKDLIVNDKAKALAEKRHQVLRNFYDDFMSELEESK